jgi:hypothetical protein
MLLKHVIWSKLPLLKNYNCVLHSFFFVLKLVLFLFYRQPLKLLKYMCSIEIIYET